MAELDALAQKRILEGIGAADDERDEIVAPDMAGVGDLLHLRWLRAAVGIEGASDGLEQVSDHAGGNEPRVGAVHGDDGGRTKLPLRIWRQRLTPWHM